MTLADLDVGSSAKVMSFLFNPDDNTGTRRALELGIRPGIKVKVAHKAPLGGNPLAVQTPTNLIALGKKEAATIVVEEVEHA